MLDDGHFCGDCTEHGMHRWQARRTERLTCLGWWPRPRDDESWPITRRPRWVRKDRFWHPHKDGCRYCGELTGKPGLDHPPAQCALCGSVQCHRGTSCQVCMRGFLPAYRPGAEGICGYSGCDRVAVASVKGRVRRVCKGCVPRVPVPQRPVKLDQLVQEFIKVRDSGKQPTRWRLVA